MQTQFDEDVWVEAKMRGLKGSWIHDGFWVRGSGPRKVAELDVGQPSPGQHTKVPKSLLGPRSITQFAAVGTNLHTLVDRLYE